MKSSQSPIRIYNSLSRKKELFEPIHEHRVGMYVCGPTVYGDPHLGHARAAITYDIVFRYLKSLGYKTRYVRNITDVGHLENEIDETGEDKISKKARSEKLEPMEVAQYYTLRYHEAVRALNCLPPSIEPWATGHIPDQIQIVHKMIEDGFAYESEGSVYFDIEKYAHGLSKENNGKLSHYGKLSGKVFEDLIEGTRELKGNEEKKNPFDFALWKKAKDTHLMKWDSPWSQGFPGWHLECTAMSLKYLGLPFDIHGGGMDLKFPHHECEIAQCQAIYGHSPVKYWMHNNLMTLQGQKMSKTAGNFISLEEFFSGQHALLEQAYSPMTIRFFYLLAHYRSEVDFSNDGLRAAENGYKRLMSMLNTLQHLTYPLRESINKEEDEFVLSRLDKLYTEMSDDFNTPRTLAHLFELGGKINAYKNNQLPLSSISRETFSNLKKTYHHFVVEILGLIPEKNDDNEILDGVMDLIIELRLSARKNKDFASSDKIREGLKKIGVNLMDNPDGSTSYKLDS